MWLIAIETDSALLLSKFVEKREEKEREGKGGKMVDDNL
jgi:hypothetical protein